MSRVNIDEFHRQLADAPPSYCGRRTAMTDRHERVRNATLEDCASEFEGQYTDSCPGTNISAATPSGR